MQPRLRGCGKLLESSVSGSMSLNEAFSYPVADNRSLKNHGVEEEANRMFEMGEETMRLPLEEKMKYEQGDDGRSFGSANLLLGYRTIHISQSDIKPRAAVQSTGQASKTPWNSSTSPKTMRSLTPPSSTVLTHLP